MEYKEIDNILNRKVFLVQEATAEERQVFSDKKEGGFFTFALESGQRFVSCFSEEDSGFHKKRRMIFRPLNHMVKGLKEFSWIVPIWEIGNILFGGAREEFKFEENLSDQEQRAFKDVLEYRVPDSLTGMDDVIPLFYAADKKAKNYLALHKISVQQKAIQYSQGR